MRYFHRETALPPYIPLPRFLLGLDCSCNARLLYGLLLDRTLLSRRSGWYDDRGAVYVIYPICQMARDLRRSERTVKTVLSELEGAGLIRRVRQGQNRANRIYLKLPEDVPEAAPRDVPEPAPPTGGFSPPEGRDAAPPAVQKLPTSKNNQEKNQCSETMEREAPLRLGEYQNVLLTKAQLADLQSRYPGQWKSYVERLSLYMAAKGAQYRDHCAVIKSWIQRDGEKAPGKVYDYTCSYERGECL